jgi:hypothetical protein
MGCGGLTHNDSLKGLTGLICCYNQGLSNDGDRILSCRRLS